MGAPHCRWYLGWVWTAPKTADVGIPLRKITSSSILPSTSSWGSCRDVQGPWHHGISFQETMTFKANARGFCFSCPSLRHETLNFENGSFLGHGGIPSYPFFFHRPSYWGSASAVPLRCHGNGKSPMEVFFCWENPLQIGESNDYKWLYLGNKWEINGL